MHDLYLTRDTVTIYSNALMQAALVAIVVDNHDDDNNNENNIYDLMFRINSFAQTKNHV